MLIRSEHTWCTYISSHDYEIRQITMETQCQSGDSD